MDDTDCVEMTESVALLTPNDAKNESVMTPTCGENAVSKAAEDTVVEIEEESLNEDNETTDVEPQAGKEEIEVAVVTCAKDADNDADSSLEVFFDIDNETVDESTKLELQIEVDKTTSEILEDTNIETVEEQTVVSIETSKIEGKDDKVSEDISTILPCEEKENHVLTNGTASSAADESVGEAEIVTNKQSLIEDDIVILSDDENDAEITKPLTEEEEQKDKATTVANDESKNNLAAAVSTEEETVEKIPAVTEILDESNTSDSSNLLEISTVQEEREKERLQEKSVEDDEEDEDEDVEIEEEEDDEAEKANENDIEVVESNLDNDISCSPPAKRSKLNDDEKKEDSDTLPISNGNENVHFTEKDEIKPAENNNADEEIKTDNLNTEKQEEKSEDIEMQDNTNAEESVVKINQIENGVEISDLATSLSADRASVPLQFLNKFKKRFETMNRTELEEFVTSKIIESFIYKSQFAETNKLLKIQEQVSERHRVLIQELSKQLRDLNMVHHRVIKDLETHYSQIVLPVKITRAVGLQVSIPKRTDLSTVGSAKKDQPAGLTTKNNEEEKINSTLPNAQSMNAAPIINITQTPADIVNSTNSALNRSAPSLIQTPLYDANIPSTSGAAKESTLQIRKIQTTTPTIEENANKKLTPNTKEIMPTTSIPASVYTMPNYISSLNQLSSGAVTITPAKPKEKECIDLTEDDDCVVMPPTNVEAPILTSHILNTNQVYRQRINHQVTPHNVSKNSYRYRAPFGPATMTTATANNMNITAVVRKTQTSNTSFLHNNMRNTNESINSGALLNNTPAPPLVMIPTNTQNSVQPIMKRKIAKSPVHPAPLPYVPPPILRPEWKKPPPKPCIRINTATNGGIVISWTMDEPEDQFAQCISYQIYAYQQTSSLPQTDFWRYVGDVKAMLLPMAVTLTQFQEGQRYFFAVRAVDVYKRYGPFSAPRTWT